MNKWKVTWTIFEKATLCTMHNNLPVSILLLSIIIVVLGYVFEWIFSMQYTIYC